MGFIADNFWLLDWSNLHWSPRRNTGRRHWMSHTFEFPTCCCPRLFLHKPVAAFHMFTVQLNSECQVSSRCSAFLIQIFCNAHRAANHKQWISALQLPLLPNVVDTIMGQLKNSFVLRNIARFGPLNEGIQVQWICAGLLAENCRFQTFDMEPSTTTCPPSVVVVASPPSRGPRPTRRRRWRRNHCRTRN